MKKIHPLTLSILSGFLLFAAWPTSPFTALIFIAWIPLLWIAENTPRRIPFFLHSYLAMFIWNIGTTWWIWNASAGGAVGAIIANAFLMCIPLWGYHLFKYKFGSLIGYTSLVVFWMTFEYIHLNWQLSWPWLTLGNVFATNPHWVQWYEFTGTSGGTLWVLLVNILLTTLLLKWKAQHRNKNIRHSLVAGCCLLLPVALSYGIDTVNQPFNNPTIQLYSNSTNVVVVQPNIDPYNEKFASGSVEGQIEKMLTLSRSAIDTNTRLVIWPETALPIPVLQNDVQNISAYQPVFNFINLHPNITLLTGIETFKFYGAEKATNTARKNADGYYDAFNAAVAMKAGEPLQFYNKSKLVPGVETLPDFLLWLGPIFEKFGGTAGGYGHQDESADFKMNNNPYVSAPIICYESIYGEYVASYVRKGATILTIVTNDGWWFDTPGHRQHLHYARLRAIETRRWVARSANTGISAMIDDKGNLVETRKWDKASVIKANIPALTKQTFFVKYGDVLSRIVLGLFGVLVLWNIITIIKARISKRVVTK